MSREIEVAADAAAFRDMGASLIERYLAESGARAATVMLAGGSTPLPVYRALTSRSVDWRGLHVFWSDERCVAPDDERSNYRAARVALLDQAPIPPENVHRIHGELPPSAAAARATAELHAITGGNPVDLVVLGMGADGHVASLFPNAPALEVRDMPYVPAEGPLAARVTATLPAINSAHRVLVLVQGAAKAAMVRAVLEGPPTRSRPAALVGGGGGAVIWLLDAEAASEL